MTHLVRHCLFASLMVLVPSLAVGEQVKTKTIPLPGYGEVQLEVPTSWQHEVSQSQDDGAPTVVFTSSSGPRFQLLISPSAIRGAGQPLPGPGEIRTRVGQLAKGLLPAAIEKEIRVEELKGRSAIGYYYSLTDKAPEPDGFEYLTQGMVLIGDLLLTFTVLANDRSDEVKDQAIAALERGTFRGSPSRPSNGSQVGNDDRILITESPNEYVLTVPASRLTMTMPNNGFALETNPHGGAADHPRYFHFQEPGERLSISGWFEPDHGYRGMREFWRSETNAWRKSRLPEPRHVSFEKIGKWDVVIYDVEDPAGSNMHVRAHWIQAGTWIDLHLSIIGNQSNAEARPVLESLLRSIVVTEKRKS